MAQLVIPPELRNLDRSTSKLTEVAKRVAIPRGIVGTDWGPVADTCRNEMGIVFDGWQDGMGQLALARSTEEPLYHGGMLAHTVGGFHLSASRQIGKCLATDTEVLTANRGWITMADIRVGDKVFHPNGHTTGVTAVHDVMLSRDCYEVVTTDGRRITTDGEHLWTVRDKRPGGHPVRNVSTAEMLKTGLERSLSGQRTVITDGKAYRTSEYRFTLPQQHSLNDLPEQELLIDPYLLGAWLGNGSAHTAQLTVGDQDIDHWNAAVISAGFTPRSTFTTSASGSRWGVSIRDDDGTHRRVRSFLTALRQLNLVNNKHIPEQYLIGSTVQRLALLQGLLDTDGHITEQSGTIEFCSMTEDLADGVLFLARSLGWRATLKEGKAKLNGHDHGVKYRVTFTPKLSDPHTPFRLQRRIDRIGNTDGGRGRFTVSIKSIQPVASVPVRCIRVASPDGLFLAGRDLIATHNTYWGAGLYFGMCQHYPGLLGLWTAHHSKTSDETFESMQAFARRRMVEPFIEKILTGSGDEEIRFWNGSRILFGARERGFGRGIPGVDMLFFDEAQILSEKALQAMLATINVSWLGLHIHAGTPPATEEIHKAQHWLRSRDEAWIVEDPTIITTETEDLVWVEFGADDNADLDDVRQWVKCNPSVPHRTPFHSIQRLRRNLNDAGFRHEGLGLYDEDDGSIFDLKRWSGRADSDAEQPRRAALVLDVSPDRKWSAIGIACEYVGKAFNDDVERSLVMVKSLPGTAGAAAAIAELRDEHDLVDVRITPGAARAVETDLTGLSIEYEVMPAAEVAAAYGNMQKAIENGTVVHLDQPELNFALQNSKSRYLQTGEAESFDRRGYSVDVSPGVAAACALYRWGLCVEPEPFIL